MGIGTHETTTITKPSCVKIIKKLGLTVKDFVYGNGFSILLTGILTIFILRYLHFYSSFFCLFRINKTQIPVDDNKIFYTGRNIFPFNAKITSFEGNLTKLSDNSEITTIPIELREFSNCERIKSIYAGNEHFILLTDNGKVLGWGSNSNYQLGSIDSLQILHEPVNLKIEEEIKQIECGNLFTIYLSSKFFHLCS